MASPTTAAVRLPISPATGQVVAGGTLNGTANAIYNSGMAVGVGTSTAVGAVAGGTAVGVGTSAGVGVATIGGIPLCFFGICF